jgi:hypothetical protein
MKTFLPSKGIEAAGWLCGLAAAAGCDHVLIPWLAEKTGHMPIAVVIGLALGAMIMFVFGEAPQLAAKTTGQNRRVGAIRRGIGSVLVRRWSFSTVTYTFLVGLTILAVLLGQLLPAASLK